MIPRFIAVSAALFVAASVHAVPIVRDAALTLYAQDLGLVRETRAVKVAGGGFTLDAIAPRYDASSVRLAPRGFRVLGWSVREPGFEWLERWGGKPVRVVEVGDRIVEGTLVAGDDAALAIQGASGTTVVYRTQIKEVASTQALEVTPPEPALAVAAEGAGGEVEFSYLTGGLSWQAEHVVVRAGEAAAEWSASVLMRNQSGADFQRARVQLVAGEPHRAQAPPVPAAPIAMRMAAAEAAEPAERPFAEYHLYTLEGPYDLRDRETRSGTLLAPRSVQVTPRYLYSGQMPGGVRAQLQLVNTKGSGLGVPLAGGRVRFYQRDEAGALLFTGEDRLKHTAVDEKLTLEVGTAFDLAAERRVMEDRRISDRERERAVEIKLRNRKKASVTIVVEEPVGGDFEVIRRSHEFVRKDANTLEFTVPVKPGEEVKVEYAVRVRW